MARLGDASSSESGLAKRVLSKFTKVASVGLIGLAGIVNTGCEMTDQQALGLLLGGVAPYGKDERASQTADYLGRALIAGDNASRGASNVTQNNYGNGNSNGSDGGNVRHLVQWSGKPLKDYKSSCWDGGSQFDAGSGIFQIYDSGVQFLSNEKSYFFSFPYEDIFKIVSDEGGWLDTVDRIYFGARNWQTAQVYHRSIFIDKEQNVTELAKWILNKCPNATWEIE